MSSNERKKVKKIRYYLNNKIIRYKCNLANKIFLQMEQKYSPFFSYFAFASFSFFFLYKNFHNILKKNKRVCCAKRRLKIPLLPPRYFIIIIIIKKCCWKNIIILLLYRYTYTFIFKEFSILRRYIIW